MRTTTHPLFRRVGARRWYERQGRIEPYKGLHQATEEHGGATREAASGEDVHRSTGYAVGEVELPVAAKGDRRNFIRAERSFLRHRHTGYIGTWHKDGELFVDPTQIIEDLDEAIALAVKNKQAAIWDFAEERERFAKDGWK